MELTERQKQILAVIRREVRTRGYPPTVREIAAEVGLSSPASVHSQLAALERKGAIRRQPDKRRALEVVEARTGRRKARGESEPRGLPVVGRVAAGAPLLAEENIEEYVAAPDFITQGDDSFLLRVRGDSMINAGILDGDLVVVRRQDSAQNGDVVVALVEGEEATLKRFFHEKDHIRLQPENESLEPIIAVDVQVIGRVTGVMRRM